MFSSNIIVGSNVYLSKKECPIWDEEFVAQIQDYCKLVDISKRRQVDNRIAFFSGNQGGILQNAMPCAFAHNDPCWGFSKDRKQVVCKCINKQCERIYSCNPFYKKEAEKWIISKKEKRMYGDPYSLPKYYFVDMVSEAERLRYQQVEEDGWLIPEEQENDNLPPTSDRYRTKIDPKTGRKKIVIGYKWVLDNVGNFEGEDLIPIWGYVDEIEIHRPKKRKISKIIEKKEESQRLKKISSVKNDIDSENNKKYEDDVKIKIANKCYKLTDITEELLDNKHTFIIVDNPAEKAYVSSMLLVNEVRHDYSGKGRVSILTTDEYEKLSKKADVVLLSNTVQRAGCRTDIAQSWKYLSTVENLFSLIVPDREYYEFKYGDSKSRWCCRNMYGVTHVIVENDDVLNIDINSDGIYPVSLVEDRDTYLMLEQDGSIVGRLKSEFAEMIDSLKKASEISGSPAVIKGTTLSIIDKKIDVLGMGNLKFIEY